MRETSIVSTAFLVALTLRVVVAVSTHVDLVPVDEHSGHGGWRLAGVSVQWVKGEPRGPDAATYDRLAWNLARGQGYRTTAFLGREMRAFRPFLFPFVLSLVYRVSGHSILAGKILQCVLGAALCPLVYGLARHLFGKRAAVLAAVLTAIYPSFLYYSICLGTETLYALCVVSMVWLLLRAAEEFRQPLAWAPAGIVLALGVLTRSALAGFALALLPWALISQPRRARALYGWLFCTVMAAFVLTPWLMRNYLVLGSPVLTTDGGCTFWSGNHPRSDGGGECITPEIPTYLYILRLDEAAMDREFYRDGWRFIREDPSRFVRLMGARVWRMWRPWPHAEHVGAATAIVGAAEFVPVFLLAILGVVLVRHRWRQLLLIGFLAGYMTAVHMLFMAVTRYRVPLMPFFIIIASAAVVQVAGGRVSKGVRT